MDILTAGAMILVTALFVTQQARAGAHQSHASIQDAALAHLLEETAEQKIKPEITVGRLDSRLRLTQCSEKLEAFTPSGRKLLGKTTVGIRCTGAKPWTIYVPLKVSIMGTVLVAAEDIARGSIVAASDLVAKRHDLSQLHRGYLSDPQKAVGKRVKRRIRQGQILKPNQLVSRKMVKKGESVTILAQSGRIQIRSKGKALAHGAEGERIRVRNLRSKKILEARVIAYGIVRVDL